LFVTCADSETAAGFHLLSCTHYQRCTGTGNDTKTGSYTTTTAPPTLEPYPPASWKPPATVTFGFPTMDTVGYQAGREYLPP